MKTRILQLSFIALSSISAFAQNVPSYVPSNGLVGWWPFNGNANDESGNGNNGTVNGASFSPDRFNNSGAACNLDNQAGDNIAIPSINFGNDFTISIWFKLNNYNQVQASSFFSQYDGNMGIELNYTVNPSILLYSLIGPEADPTKRMYSLFSVGLGNWNHLVWIKSGNFSEFTLNGNSIYQQSNLSNVTINNGIAYFGKAQWGGNELFGLIDDIGIWNRALTQQEIIDLFNGSSANAAERNLTTLNVHPNPTSGEITITNNETYLQSYSLYNSLGQLVASGMLNAENTTVSIQEFAPGIYTLQWQGEKNTALKIVKE